MNKQSLEMVSVRLRMPRYLKELAEKRAKEYKTNMSNWIRKCIEWSEIEDQTECKKTR